MGDYLYEYGIVTPVQATTTSATFVGLHHHYIPLNNDYHISPEEYVPFPNLWPVMEVVHKFMEIHKMTAKIKSHTAEENHHLNLLR